MSFQTEALAQETSQTTGFKHFILNFVLKIQKWMSKKLLNKSRMTDKATIKFLGKKLPAKWLREFSAFNVCDYLTKVDCNTLVISGGKDIQVDPNEVYKMEN